MGEFAIKWHVKLIAWLIAAVLIYLNIRMAGNEIAGFFQREGLLGWKILIVVGCIFFFILFILMTLLPILKKKRKANSSRLHKEAQVLQHFDIPKLDCIAIALDFTNNDERLIANALSQGNKTTKFLLLHIVESVSARVFGNVSDDYETRNDREHIDSYVLQLKALGFVAEGHLGYRDRIKEIVRISNENKANMLVMGAHRHSGVMDYLYGETVEKVRHQLKIPVLIVN